MTELIALCGKKQSGKTTLSNYLHGHEMQRHDVVREFFVSPEGNLVVNALHIDDKGEHQENMGVLNLKQNTPEFFAYASRSIWPLIRGYSFADALKEVCVTLFNVPVENIYGTNEQKNQKIDHLRWENMPGVVTPESIEKELHDSLMGMVLHEPGPMTAREFMQFFGTDVLRKIWEPIWLHNCLSRIQTDLPPIAIIDDCRFVNEIEAVKKAGGKVIKLTRSKYESTHQSEVDADNYSDFDAVIDNQEMTQEESQEAFLDILIDWGLTTKIRKIGKTTAQVRAV